MGGLRAGAETLERLARQATFIKRNIEALSFNHCYSERAIIITYSECVSVALVTQHAERKHLIFIRGLPGYTIFPPTLSHKRHDFRDKKLLNIKCVFWFSLQSVFEKFLILGRIHEDIIINAQRASSKVPVIL